jgi:hypothetical protein
MIEEISWAGAMVTVAVGKRTGVSVAGIAVGMSVGSAVDVGRIIGVNVGTGADSIGSDNFPPSPNPRTSPTASTQIHPKTPIRPMMIRFTGFWVGGIDSLIVVISSPFPILSLQSSFVCSNHKN